MNRKDANNPDLVAQGFDITIDIHEIIEMAHTFYNEDGSPKKKVNSDRRLGITAIPLESGVLGINQNIPPVHGGLHILKHLEHIGYTYNARHAFPNPDFPTQGMGTTKTEEEKIFLSISKNEFRNQAKDKNGLNLPLDRIFTNYLSKASDLIFGFFLNFKIIFLTRKNLLRGFFLAPPGRRLR